MRAEAKKPIKSRKTGAKLYASTVSRQLAVHRSSQRDNRLSIYLVFISLAQNAGLFFCLQCVFDYLFVPAGPRNTAAVVSAKNMPQAYFPNASTVLKEIIAYRYILYLSASHKMRGCFFVCNVFSIISLLLRVLAAQLMRFRLIICHRLIF